MKKSWDIESCKVDLETLTEIINSRCPVLPTSNNATLFAAVLLRQGGMKHERPEQFMEAIFLEHSIFSSKSSRGRKISKMPALILLEQLSFFQ